VPDTTLKILMVVNFTLVKWTDENEIPIKNPKAIPIIAVITIRLLSFPFDLLNALEKT
jgi:hypothetical protein